MGIRWMGVALAVLSMSVSVGCGGSELKPTQQREYDKLKAEQSTISKSIGATTRRADKAFNDLGAAEKRKKLVFKQVVLCGATASNQTFGPFAWGKKRRAKLLSKGNKSVSGQSCQAYDLKVVK